MHLAKPRVYRNINVTLQFYLKCEDAFSGEGGCVANLLRYTYFLWFRSGEKTIFIFSLTLTIDINRSKFNYLV